MLCEVVGREEAKVSSVKLGSTKKMDFNDKQVISFIYKPSLDSQRLSFPHSPDEFL